MVLSCVLDIRVRVVVLVLSCVSVKCWCVVSDIVTYVTAVIRV